MTRLEGFDIYLKVAQWYTVMAKSIGAVKAGLYVSIIKQKIVYYKSNWSLLCVRTHHIK